MDFNLMISNVIFFLGVASQLLALCYGHLSKISVQPEVVVVKQGESIQVNCSINIVNADILDFKWQALGHELEDDMYSQIRIEKNVVALVIPNAQPVYTGAYRCKIHTSDGIHMSNAVLIHVKQKETDCTLSDGNLCLEMTSERYFGQTLVVETNQNVQVNCSSIKGDVLASDLRWEVTGSPSTLSQENVRVVQMHHYIVSLQITEVSLLNTGIYSCRQQKNENKHIDLKIQVTEPGVDYANTRFCKPVCDDTIQVKCHKICDGNRSCPLGEYLCKGDVCHKKFRCKNDRCVDYSSMCDGLNDCADWSDEDRCWTVKPSAVTVKTTGEENPLKTTVYTLNAEEDNPTKTTVYTVISCTVGIAFLITVIVIAIFRIKMKHAAVRRTLRQAGRRRRNSERRESESNVQPQRTEPVEHDPFISAPSPTDCGNIIIDVHNGVQYVPNAVQCPPSYSEVMADSGRFEFQHNLPPPEYSTLDRDRRRNLESHDSEIQIQ